MRIKTFKLFEATKRSVLVDEFRQEVLANKWAAGIIGIGCSFDIRSPVFGNVVGAGSKTSIYSIHGGGYGHKSLSQGVPFGVAEYPTLNECLKGLYMYILRKQVKIRGIKKDLVEKAIEEIGADNIIGKSLSDIETMIRNHMGKPKGQPLSELLDPLNFDFNKLGLLFVPNGPDMIRMGVISPLDHKNYQKNLLPLILPPIIFGVSPSDVSRLVTKYWYPYDTYYSDFFIEYKYTGNKITRKQNKIQIPYTASQEEIKNYISDFAKKRLRSIEGISGFTVDGKRLTSLFDEKNTIEIAKSLIEMLISGTDFMGSDYKDYENKIAPKLAEVIKNDNTGSQSKLIDAISKNLPEIWMKVKPLLGSGAEQHLTLGDLGF